MYGYSPPPHTRIDIHTEILILKNSYTQRVPDRFFDTPQPDSLSIYLRNELQPQAAADTISSSAIRLGDYHFLPTDSMGIAFDADKFPTFVLSEISRVAGASSFLPNDWQSTIFLLMMGCFFLFCFFVSKERVSLINNFKNIFVSSKKLATSTQQVTALEAWAESFFVLQTMMFGGVSAVVMAWRSQMIGNSWQDGLLFFGAVVAILLVLLLYKFTIYRIADFMLFSRRMKKWIKRYIWLLELTGIVGFLPVLAFVYLPEWHTILGLTIIGIFLVSRVLAIALLLKFFVKNEIGLFYFIPYLCGVEIAPYLFAYKGVSDFINTIRVL